MKGRRVAVTGLGIVSPLGNDREVAWANLTRGQSGVGRITKFDPAKHACQIAAEVKDFVDADIFPARYARRTDLFIRYAITAAAEAMADAGLDRPEVFDTQRAGVLIGSGIGGLPMIERAHDVFHEGGPRKVSPFFIPSAIINMAAGWVSLLFGLRGPNIAIATACTTGSHCIGEGGRKIAYGDADIIVAGGTESTITPLTVAGFAASQALSLQNKEPQKASRPFDTARDGFVLGEGAGILVLEEWEHAQARDAKIYCELVGYGASDDAHHITAPPEDGAGANLSMTNALADADVDVTSVDHINAHGTSTPLGDRAETIAIKQVFGDHARQLAISATKSMTGHLLGAAGGIEAVFTALAIECAKVPPTINLDEPDQECDLDYVAGDVARPMPVRVAMSNSFGFGGTNATLVFAAR